MKLIQDISPDDGMFAGNKEHYFHVGESAIECIMSGLSVAGKDVNSIKNILDLPCGYGRVLRYLKATFPEAILTACDLNKAGVNFCAQKFGAYPVYSDKNISNVNFDTSFDLIWVGSLFTHLDSNKWDEFIRFFSQKLNPSGLLIISFHGPTVVPIIRDGKTYGLEPNELISLLTQYILNQFAYVNYIYNDDYGISLSSPSFTRRIFEKYPELCILSYTEKAWDDHHDILVCEKK
jgi:SAM-dependent methyltransferase